MPPTEGFFIFIYEEFWFCISLFTVFLLVLNTRKSSSRPSHTQICTQFCQCWSSNTYRWWWGWGRRCPGRPGWHSARHRWPTRWRGQRRCRWCPAARSGWWPAPESLRLASVEEGVGEKTGREQEVSKKKAQEHEDEYVLTFTNFIVQMQPRCLTKLLRFKLPSQ